MITTTRIAVDPLRHITVDWEITDFVPGSVGHGLPDPDTWIVTGRCRMWRSMRLRTREAHRGVVTVAKQPLSDEFEIMVSGETIEAALAQLMTDARAQCTEAEDD